MIMSLSYVEFIEIYTEFSDQVMTMWWYFPITQNFPVNIWPYLEGDVLLLSFFCFTIL